MTTILQQTLDFLQQPIPKNNKEILIYIDELQTVILRVIEEKAEARNVQFHLSDKYRHPKDKRYTDFDREIMLNDLIADQVKEVELLQDLYDQLIYRQQLIKQLLIYPI